MITIKESHYMFAVEVNKLNASYGKAFTPYEIDILLNQGQIAFLSEKLNNKQGNGVEFDNVIMNQLSPILIHEEEVTPVNNIAEPINPVYKFISFNIRGTKNNCEKVFDECRFIKHQVILNTTQKSDWKWGICNGYIKDKKIILEPSDFTISKVYISYYRYPSVVNLGNYLDVNGNTTVTTQWDWEDDTVIEIIKKAAMLALETINSNMQTKNSADSLFN